MSVAQRYSVLVTAKNTTDQNFKIHANFDTVRLVFSSSPINS